MKNRKRQLAVLLSIFCLCIVFTSCHSRGSDVPSGSSAADGLPPQASPLLSCDIGGPGSDSPYGNSYQSGIDDAYMIHGYLSHIDLAESDTGFYFTATNSTGKYLYYMPKNTMQPQPLCNKPNCMHEERQDDPRQDMQEINAARMQCNAYVNDVNHIFFYDGSLYLVGNLDALTQDLALYRISPDGSQKDKLYSFRLKENDDENGNPVASTPVAYILGSVTAHRGYLYYVVQSPEKTALYRLPFQDGEKQPELLYVYQSQEGVATRLFYGKYLYAADIDGQGEVFYNRIDLETGQNTGRMGSVGPTYEIQSFYEGRLLLCSGLNRDGLYLADLDGSNLYKLPEPCKNPIGTAAGPYIIGYDNSQEEQERQQFTLTLYNGKGEKQGDIQVASEKVPRIDGASKDKLFLSLVTGGKRGYYCFDFCTKELSLYFSPKED